MKCSVLVFHTQCLDERKSLKVNIKQCFTCHLSSHKKPWKEYIKVKSRFGTKLSPKSSLCWMGWASLIFFTPLYYNTHTHNSTHHHPPRKVYLAARNLLQSLYCQVQPHFFVAQCICRNERFILIVSKPIVFVLVLFV